MKKFILIAWSVFLMAACQNTTDKNVESSNNQVDNKQLINSFFELFNKHEWEKMATMYSSNPEMKDPAFGPKSITMSQEDIIKKYKELNRMIPDVHDSIITMYPSGNCTTVEFISSGTAPDSTRFELPICTIFEIRDGKIVKDYTYYDNIP